MLRWFFSRREPTADQTVLLLRQFVVVSESGATLDEALPILAESLGDRRLRNRIAVYLREHDPDGDRGDSAGLLKALLPGRLAGLIDAGQEHGALPDLLCALADHEAGRASHRRRMYGVLFYPATVFTLLAAVAVLLAKLVVPQFRELFEEFELTQPPLTVAVFSAAEVAPWVAIAAIDAALAIALMLLWPPTRRLVHWLRTATPVMGRAWVWASHEQLCRQLALLTRMGLPIGDALRYAATGQHDLHLATAAARASNRCEGGLGLAEALARSRHFERPLVAMVAAGERFAALPEAMDDAARDYQEQLEQYVQLLSRVLLPLVTVMVGLFVLGVLAALLVPLISLIENLS